mgnify:CR=1 FL=1
MTGFHHVSWCIVFALAANGCDPTRTTSQIVGLRISNSSTGEPVANAQVALKELREHSPWFEGKTNKNGLVEIKVTFSALDRSRGPTPSSESDFVTNNLFVIRVNRGNDLDEEVRLIMKPGNSLAGHSITAAVTSIEAPRYIEDEDSKTPTPFFNPDRE